MIKNSKVAIIIVNWKQYELTKSCLLSLKKINCVDHQIILIDNESNQKELKRVIPGKLNSTETNFLKNLRL